MQLDRHQQLKTNLALKYPSKIQGLNLVFKINFLKRRKYGLTNYLRKNSARKHLRNSQEYAKSFDQLVVFAFDNITFDIILNGKSERYILELIADKFGDFLKEKVILDIGANIGNHTLAFSKIAKEVFSFEPNPIVFELLSINTRNLKNVDCLNFGASNADKVVTAYVPEGKFGSGTIAEEHQEAKFRKPRFNLTQTKFEVKRVDGISKISKKDIGLIKLDVEGHELAALQGLEGILKKQDPIVMFEQNRNILDETSMEVEFLKEQGYSFFYEFVQKDQWISPLWLPKLLLRTLKLLEVAILGEPNPALELRRISKLQNKDYPAILASRRSLVD